jgi:hypothetical protein
MTDAITQDGYSNELARIADGGDDPTTVSTLTAVLDTTGPVRSGAINAAGSGYSVYDVLTATGGGGDATFTVTEVGTSGEVEAIAPLAAGTGYGDLTGDTTSVAPSGGSSCTLDIVADLPVDSVTVTEGGAGYEFLPNIEITDPDTGDTTAVLVPVLSGGAIASVTVSDGGGYLTGGPPTLVVAKAPPADAAAYETAMDAYETAQHDARLKGILIDAQAVTVMTATEATKVQTLIDSL